MGNVNLMDICSLKDCTQPVYSHRFCKLHYGRSWNPNPGARGVRRDQRSRLKVPENQVDLAYIAGLIDGEGSIIRRATGYWQVAVIMTDKEVIDWLAAVGGTAKAQDRRGKLRSYDWRLSPQSQVGLFLSAILPYMKVHSKRSKALAAITEIGKKSSQSIEPQRKRSSEAF